MLSFFLINKGGRGQIKQKKKTVPQKVTIAKIPRAKKKYVTRVCGLATFGEFKLKCVSSVQTIFSPRVHSHAGTRALSSLSLSISLSTDMKVSQVYFLLRKYKMRFYTSYYSFKIKF